MRRFRNSIIRLAESLISVLPDSLWQPVTYVWFRVVSKRRPEEAMRRLLEVEEYLTRQINAVAIRYDDGIHVKHRLMRYHDFFVDRLRPGERVLDIGCGVGAVANSMATRAEAVVTGVDISRDNLATAKKHFRHPNLTFMEGDVLQELPLGSYDTIVMSNVLEHFEGRAEFLKATQSRINPRRWLIRVPMINRHWLVPMRQELGLPYFSDDTHFVEYTQQSFEEEMQAAHMTITDLQINWGEIWAEVRSTESVHGE